MLLNSACLDEFRPFRRTHILCWTAIGFQVATKGQYASETQLYGFIMMVSLAAVLHIIYYSINEMKTFLGIRFLSIESTKRQRRQVIDNP